MAKQEQRDMREYAIFTHILSTTTAGTLAFIPIPRSGQVVRLMSCVNTPITTNPDVITLELSGVPLLKDGATAQLSITEVSSAVGDIAAMELDPLEPLNLALEAVDGEALADGGTLEIISTGASGAGAATFAVVIRV